MQMLDICAYAENGSGESCGHKQESEGSALAFKPHDPTAVSPVVCSPNLRLRARPNSIATQNPTCRQSGTLYPFVLALGCVLRANPLFPGTLGEPVGDITRPLRLALHKLDA
jgi:hypothetical protein